MISTGVSRAGRSGLRNGFRDWKGLALACGVAALLSGCAANGREAAKPAASGPVPAPATAAPAVPQSQAAPMAAPAERADLSFEDWKAELRAEALRKGISAQTLDRTLPGITFQPRVLELDRTQPELAQTVWTYLRRAISDQRISQGRVLLKKHAALLSRIESQYGVPGPVLVAFWGMETNYGSNFGGFSVLSALSTLAYDTRRSAFFRKELFDALAIIQAGHITPDKMIGSWAGAMGNMQFMPSTFRAYAVDGDGDGRIDVWNSLPDAFASAAHYLSSVGWRSGETWGQQVVLPAGFDPALADSDLRRSLAEWQASGVRGLNAPRAGVPTAALGLSLPAGLDGPAFLTGPNFRTIMVWNRSALYALAVGNIADQLTDGPAIRLDQYPEQRALTRTETTELQSLLARLGYDAGTPDGVFGARSRAALKAFQVAQGRPADAYPDAAELDALRRAAGQ